MVTIVQRSINYPFCFTARTLIYCLFFVLGCLATAGALSFGLYSFKQGERKMSQYMMRARIFAQGFTVVALILGVGLSLSTKVPVRKND